MYGAFFEDINYGADGGINAEQVVNNSFEYKGYNGIAAGASIAENFFKYWADNTEGLSMESSIVSKSIASDSPMNDNNPNYLYLNIKQSVPAYKLYNYGYQGGVWESDNADYVAGLTESYAMNIVKGHVYRLSFYADLSPYASSDAADQFEGNIRAYLRSNTEDKISDAVNIAVDNVTGWTKYTAELKATHTDLGALALQFDGVGKINLDCISLMDADSWGTDDPRYSGGKFRTDLIEAIADMHPKFFRFPGGCAAEGTLSWDNAYMWKNSIGALEERKGVPNLWGYYQSYGIGFYEYFLLCEDLDMAPVPVIPCGLVCQARMGTDGALMIDAATDPAKFQTEVVDNFAHLVYFARGSEDSADEAERYWAGKRAEMGHPAPFTLDTISLGNENWGAPYRRNFEAAVKALRAYEYAGETVDFIEKWGLRVVTTSGTDFDGRAAWDADYVKFNYNYDWINNTKEGEEYLYDNDTFIVDEHYYMLPGATGDTYSLLGNLNRYDRNGAAPQGTKTELLGGRSFYNRDGAKVFVGEYAANYWNNPSHASANGGKNFNGLYSAIAEAAYMCNFERNSDIVEMASYAPLLARKGADGWAVDGIWFNAAGLVKTPNYFVQEMFGSYVGDVYIPSRLAVTDTESSVTVDTTKKEIYVKLVNWSGSTHNVTVDLSGMESLYPDISNSYTLYQMGAAGGVSTTAGIRNEIDAYDGKAVYNVKPNYYTYDEATGKLVDKGGEEQSGAVTLPGTSVSVLVFTYGERHTGDATATFSVYGSKIDAVASDDAADEAHINTVAVPYATYAYRRIPTFKITPADANAEIAADYATSLEGNTTVTLVSGSDTKIYKFRYVLGDKPTITLNSARAATINTEGAYTLDYTASVGDTVRVVTSGGYYIADRRIFFAVTPGDYVLTLVSGTDSSVTEKVYVTVVTAPEVKDADAPTPTPAKKSDGCNSDLSPISACGAAILLLGAGLVLARRKRSDRI